MWHVRGACTNILLCKLSQEHACLFLQALGQLEGRIEELNGQLDALKVAMPGLAGGSFGGMIKAA